MITRFSHESHNLIMFGPPCVCVSHSEQVVTYFNIPNLKLTMNIFNMKTTSNSLNEFKNEVLVSF